MQKMSTFFPIRKVVYTILLFIAELCISTKQTSIYTEKLYFSTQTGYTILREGVIV